MNYNQDPYRNQVGRFYPTEAYPNHGKPWTPAQEGQLAKMVRLGFSQEEIAKRMGRYPSAIAIRIERLELESALVSVHLTLPDHREHMKEQKTMKIHHLITLLQKGYTTVNVYFQDDEQRSTIRSYTYKISEALAKELEPGHPVVVPVGEGKVELKVAYVREVHPEPEIDVKAPYALKWVVCRVDTSPWEDQCKREEQVKEALVKGERKKAQAEALAALLETVPNRDEIMALLNPPA